MWLWSEMEEAVVGSESGVGQSSSSLVVFDMVSQEMEPGIKIAKKFPG
jgi:hypothetical protein